MNLQSNAEIRFKLKAHLSCALKISDSKERLPTWSFKKNSSSFTVKYAVLQKRDFWPPHCLTSMQIEYSEFRIRLKESRQFLLIHTKSPREIAQPWLNHLMFYIIFFKLPACLKYWNCFRINVAIVWLLYVMLFGRWADSTRNTLNEWAECPLSLENGGPNWSIW